MAPVAPVAPVERLPQAVMPTLVVTSRFHPLIFIRVQPPRAALFRSLVAPVALVVLVVLRLLMAMLMVVLLVKVATLP